MAWCHRLFPTVNPSNPTGLSLISQNFSYCEIDTTRPYLRKCVGHNGVNFATPRAAAKLRARTFTTPRGSARGRPC